MCSPESEELFDKVAELRRGGMSFVDALDEARRVLGWHYSFDSQRGCRRWMHAKENG